MGIHVAYLFNEEITNSIPDKSTTPENAAAFNKNAKLYSNLSKSEMEKYIAKGYTIKGYIIKDGEE